MKNKFFCAAAGIAIALLVKIFVLDIYRVQGRSMEGAIKDGGLIFVNKTAYGLQNPFKPELLFQWRRPKTGEAVIYMYKNAWVVKRCAAVSGDALVFEGEDSVLVNGKKIPLTPIQYHRMRTGPFVPAGYVFAVGDNYEESLDSRSYGFVPEKNIVARVIAKM